MIIEKGTQNVFSKLFDVLSADGMESLTFNEEWAVRLRYAYADALEAAGRNDEAREWFAKCANLDPDEETDALERSQK